MRWEDMRWVSGLSARAIAGAGTDHPHDPADLVRCVKYCEFHNISTAELRRKMAGRSPQWDRLLGEWDALVELLKLEVETRTDGLATRTYNEMRRVIYDGASCQKCDGTGRGDECAKCKGTGRRSGGRCRAEHCWRGADLCPTCRGRGFTTPERAA